MWVPERESETKMKEEEDEAWVSGNCNRDRINNSQIDLKS